MKVEALEADLYEQCVQLKRLKELSLNSIFGNVGNSDYTVLMINNDMRCMDAICMQPFLPLFLF